MGSTGGPHRGFGATPRPSSGNRRPAPTLETRLRRCLQNGGVELEYQPVVTLPSARTIGVEALARWTDHVFGSVPPEVFIPVAERSGLIHPLGTQVLFDACRTAATWPSGQAPARVAVNVSPLQLAAPEFEQLVAQALRESGLDPCRLVLEITESAAVQDLPESATRLRALRALGVQIALDDFGIGHSPLILLRELPIDILKIDRSFVSRVHENARDAVIARLLIDTAHTLGLTVCGEGVETREQARQLMGLGCDTAQGWYFGRPEPACTELAARLQSGREQLDLALDVTQPPPIHIGSDELVTIMSPQGLLLYASGGALAVLGYTPSDLIGSSAGEHLHPDEQNSVLAGHHPNRGPDGSLLVHRARHRDGRYRWLSTRAQMLRDDRGQPAQIVATSRDVTAQVETEHQLASIEATLRWAFDQSPLGMALSTFDGAIVRTNLTFAAMLGYQPDDLIGVGVPDLTHPQDRPTDAANLRDLRSGERIVQQVTKRYVHRDGSAVQAQVWATALDDGVGEPTFVVAHVMPTGCC